MSKETLVSHPAADPKLKHCILWRGDAHLPDIDVLEIVECGWVKLCQVLVTMSLESGQ